MDVTEYQSESAFVAIVGRPNVGKSTLLNRILGQKISITSNKPQTTRHRILGIETEGDRQIVYVDTPGLHQDEKKAINRLMNRAAASSMSGVEVVLFVVEANRWTTDDEMVLNKLKKSQRPVILVVNKIDQIKDKSSLLPQLQQLAARHTFAEIVPLSAATGDQVEALRSLVHQYAKPGVHHFPEDYVTDRSLRFMTAEIVREKLMRFTGDELPYSTTVEIEQFRTADNGTTHIHALILVEREGQKRMIIGAGGSKLKTIGTEARKDLEPLIGGKVHLQLWVKVKSGWADDERALRSLGYGED
ncbi:MULTISPECIES: GTPase Era [Idiomarinaceae]|uniref:GTPase Era n=3 Tax=Pseudidiomarina TaxID=2800384 RepID=A0A368V6C5_9GAMM|nr:MULTISPECIES: GTPase Era [Idiomarinaceae]MDT7524827.1 GTPase Era [Pseudidiomarina sp. GXY010]MDX1525189.1 GTPase Era [Pseudidiomarina maritima]MRJ40971.1 GTPase Era [Idiomarina sp. FeN1]NCU56775.1 GTPase Era [Idiomarina sp. FenA--70]NCU59155.1 GTPase Era [Idiomarina sp. FenBw--71]